MSAPATQVHSCVLAPHLKEDLIPGVEGKYGRMFPELPRNDCDDDALLALGRSGAVMDAEDAQDDDRASGDNPCIPAGFPIFGQFIAHDITADRSLLQHHASVGELRSFRTPSLNLEALYGAGPTGNPYLYDRNDTDKFLLGVDNAAMPNDQPRNTQDVALIGDPRNDVHLPISQLHVAFLKFHNAIVDALREQGVAAGDVFAEAQRLVRWHYQWIAVHEFLSLSVGDEMVSDVLEHGRQFYHFEGLPYIPVEFSDGAYRFGHSQIRSVYQLNAQAKGAIFPDLGGGHQVPHAHVIDWRYFFDVDPSQPPQLSRRIDARLTHALINLPDAVVGTTEIPEYRSLACRDLQRARALDMPSGEAVARAMGAALLTADEVGLQAHGWQGETPLWYYVLKEAEVCGDGVRLGEVGGRIVTEVLIGLLDGDPASYRSAEVEWHPVLPSTKPDDFTIVDLLRFAHAI